MLATLADRRILRSLEEGGDVRYEIFHDVLAQPVLAWRARHRTERDVERQLAERHQRRSRLQRLLALGAAALARPRRAAGFAIVQRENANEAPGMPGAPARCDRRRRSRRIPSSA